MLLDEALSAPRELDGTRRARTGDGRLSVILEAPVDGRWAALETPLGVLRCSAYRITVDDAHAREPEAAASGAEP